MKFHLLVADASRLFSLTVHEEDSNISRILKAS
jgi:hypothetical protein